jgi:hypothetical protein
MVRSTASISSGWTFRPATLRNDETRPVRISWPRGLIPGQVAAADAAAVERLAGGVAAGHGVAGDVHPAAAFGRAVFGQQFYRHSRHRPSDRYFVGQLE